MLKNEAVVAHSIFNLLLVTHPEMLPNFHYYFINHLEAVAHLAPSLQNVLHHVLAPGPHGVALPHEELVEAHLVPHVSVEG